MAAPGSRGTVPPVTPRPRSTRFAVLALLATIACTRPGTPEPAAVQPTTPQPVTSADPARGTMPQPAPPTPVATVAPADPAPIPIRSAVAITGGSETHLDPAATVVVDPRAEFRVEVAAVIADGRLSLRDGQDAMVSSSGTTEVGTSWTRFHLAPDAPLFPGSPYTLHVDGNASHAPRDAAGQALRPLVLAIRTAGERPPVRVKKRGGRR